MEGTIIITNRMNFTARMRTSLQVWLMLCMIAGMLLLLSGCSKPSEEVLNPQSTEDPFFIETPLLETPTPEPTFAFSFPFTGFGSDLEQDVKKRPVMVMVENQAKARPQTGLDEADLVYEILAEGDITRFVTIFQSKSPKAIGPVRSIRPYFIEIGDALDALIVHAGYSPEAIKMINSRKLPHFDEIYGDGAYYWRDKIRKPPHNLYTGIELIRKGADKRKISDEWNGAGMVFLPQAHLFSGLPVRKVTVNYIQGYQVYYEYDEITQVYKRFMAGLAHKDKETDVQLSAANILICFTAHEILDNVGRRAVDVFGPNIGYLIQHGQRQDITWEQRDGLIRAYINGVEQGMVPGQTWIQVVPEGSVIDFE